jgi:hypothetical protein
MVLIKTQRDGSYQNKIADKTCKRPEDGVRTPKHVGIILLLILYNFSVHLFVY